MLIQSAKSSFYTCGKNMHQNVHICEEYVFFSPFTQRSSSKSKLPSEFDYVTAFHQNTPDSPSVWSSSNSSAQSLRSRCRGMRPNKHMLNVISCFVDVFCLFLFLFFFFNHSFLPPWWFIHSRRCVLCVQLRVTHTNTKKSFNTLKDIIHKYCTV